MSLKTTFLTCGIFAGWAVAASDASAQFVNPYVPNAPGVIGNPLSVPGTTNPYLPNPFPDPYYPFNPYNQYNPYSGFGPGAILQGQAAMLHGTADVMRAYGQVAMNQEQARIMRETALQARVDTARKKFDHNMYIRAMTPTYTQEQAKIVSTTLKRIQTNSTAAEIANGKSLNMLLDDIRKFPNKKISLDVFLSEDVLKSLNIVKTNGNLGLLRDEGKFTWPVALEEMLPADDLKRIDVSAQAVVKNAYKGKNDNLAVESVRREIDVIRKRLNAKVNDIPAVQYINAKQFLNEFDEALTAIDKGEAATQANYQKFIAGGKTTPELVDYLVNNGLKFASAIGQDEAAYRAVYTALANYDVVLNTHYGSANDVTTPAPMNPAP